MYFHGNETDFYVTESIFSSKRCNFKKFLCDQVKHRSLGQKPVIGLQRVPNGFAHKIAGPSRPIIDVQHKPCRSALYFRKS